MIRLQENQLTIPMRFSRHRITELLVAAEQTASSFPYNSGKRKVMVISFKEMYLNETVMRWERKKCPNSSKSEQSSQKIEACYTTRNAFVRTDWYTVRTCIMSKHYLTASLASSINLKTPGLGFTWYKRYLYVTVDYVQDKLRFHSSYKQKNINNFKSLLTVPDLIISLYLSVFQS